jgi:hypothetical protein
MRLEEEALDNLSWKPLRITRDTLKNDPYHIGEGQAVNTLCHSVLPHKHKSTNILVLTRRSASSQRLPSMSETMASSESYEKNIIARWLNGHLNV